MIDFLDASWRLNEVVAGIQPFGWVIGYIESFLRIGLNLNRVTDQESMI